VEIRPGPRSQFIVKVGEDTVAKKDSSGFPEEAAVILALRKLASPA
jgi:hypothetical protein